ncbi:MAG: T9SS type A sorting domain-containing protein, partial [Bacteroidia bacterium]
VSLPATINACASALADAGNPGATYLWSNGGTQQMEQFTSSGIYSVMVTDSNNCSASDTVNITIFALPVVNIGSDTANCVSYTLNANISGNYTWSDSSTASSLTVTSSGQYYLTVVDSNGCSGSDTVNITINQLPFVGIAITIGTICEDDADVLLAGTPPGGTFSGTSVTGNSFDPSVGAGQYDIYYTFTDANGCTGNDTLTLAVSACVGITENQEVTFSILPNPNAGNFTISLNENNSQLEITDILGNIVYSSREINSGNINVSLENQAAGIYFVRVTNGTKTGVQRLVLSR